MRYRLLSSLTACALLGGAAWCFARPDAKKAKLLETGLCRSEDVEAKTGEIWLGLYCRAKSSDCVLLSSKLKVEPVPEPGGPSYNVWVDKVSVNRSRTPIFLAKNTPLQAGTIITAFRWKSGMDIYRPITMRLSGRRYVFKTREIKLPDGTRRNHTTLSARGKTQMLLSCDFLDFASLGWAGDLDDDNKLDLYVSMGSHMGGRQGHLFLSSHVRQGMLVREVAQWGTRVNEEMYKNTLEKAKD